MNALKSEARSGFTYEIEVIRGTVFDEDDPSIVIREGVVIDRETIHNLIPQEGLDFNQSVMFKGAAQVTTWYIGIFEGNYTPTSGLTAATFPGLATECTAYTAANRLEFIEGAVSGGSVDNTASKAEFTMNAAKTVYGAVMSSSAAKGSTTGVLISAVRFAAAKVLASGDVLRITATNTLASA